jgi:hypothetical protein
MKTVQQLQAKPEGKELLAVREFNLENDGIT